MKRTPIWVEHGTSRGTTPSKLLLVTKLTCHLRYPGAACDIPSHAYQFTFESNPKWSSYWAGSAEIQAYLKAVATKYNSTKYMKFNSKAEKAEWNDDTGKWTVTFRNMNTGEV